MKRPQHPPHDVRIETCARFGPGVECAGASDTIRGAGLFRHVTNSDFSQQFLLFLSLLLCSVSGSSSLLVSCS